VYNKCVILLSKWVMLNAAPCKIHYKNLTVMLPPFKVVCSWDPFWDYASQNVVSNWRPGTTLVERLSLHTIICCVNIQECRSHLHHSRSLTSRKFVLIHQHLVVPQKKKLKVCENFSIRGTIISLLCHHHHLFVFWCDELNNGSGKKYVPWIT